MIRFVDQRSVQPLVLLFQFLQPLGLLGLHAAVLVPPAVKCLLAHLQGLADLADRLAGANHRVHFAQLLDDLLRARRFKIKHR
jgi:hypothetical protein